MPNLFWILFGLLVATFLYARFVLGLPTKQALARVVSFLIEVYQKIKGSEDWQGLVELAYQTWMCHDYPAGVPLRFEAPSPQQIEQAGLLLQALVAQELRRADLPEKIRRGHQEILKIPPRELGEAVRELILEHLYEQSGSSGGRINR